MKSAIIMVATMTSCSTAILSAKSIDITYCALTASKFSHALLQEKLQAMVAWFRVETRNFTESKVLKLTTQWNFRICQLKSVLDYSEKMRQGNALFMNDGLKQGTLKYLNTETWLLFPPLSKFLATRLPMDHRCQD